MLNIHEKDVLIIEDSSAVGILLKEFLTSLGFKKIHICENGQSGIETFNGLIDSGNVPIVFLDYTLPDMTGYSVITQLLVKNPTTKVIIETAREKTDEKIKNVIAQGAYHYLPKPIRLHNLKEIIQLIEMEEIFSEKESEITEKIEFYVKNSTQITITRIAQYVQNTNKQIIPIIKKLIDENKIKQITDVNEPACNRCNSVKIAPIFQCPACKSNKFKQEKLIEHYDCGNISSASSYEKDNCPKCKKKLKVLGVDYKVFENHYTCNDCKEIFPELSANYLCLKCNNRFTIEQANWKTSAAYTAVN